MKKVKAIKETTEWVCRDQTRALQFMTPSDPGVVA